MLTKFSLVSAVIVFLAPQCLLAQTSSRRVQQPREVIGAYRVCRRFQTLMAKDLDFDRAFEATFTRNRSRRREIAITEGEFGNLDLTSVDDATLIDAFKARMQIFYLMLPLASPRNKEEEERFFPPAMKTIFERKPPQAPGEFAAYTLQLKRDVDSFRAHLNHLARDVSVSERIRKFKRDLSKELPVPNSVVEPLTAYSRGRVLGLDEKYYQIGDYAVIREGAQMKIIGIRFFSRLF